MPCCDMRRRVLSVISTDVMWWSLMWCDQCPAKCVLCHCGIQSLVHLGRNAVKEARLLMTSKTKQFCKWKCNLVIAAYGCTDSIWGLFCYFFWDLVMNFAQVVCLSHLNPTIGFIWEWDSCLLECCSPSDKCSFWKASSLLPGGCHGTDLKVSSCYLSMFRATSSCFC